MMLELLAAAIIDRWVELLLGAIGALAAAIVALWKWGAQLSSVVKGNTDAQTQHVRALQELSSAVKKNTEVTETYQLQVLEAFRDAIEYRKKRMP